jgi:hypothetical protein
MELRSPCNEGEQFEKRAITFLTQLKPSIGFNAEALGSREKQEKIAF